MRSELIVGVISDTHGLLRPEAIAALGGSNLIVHAGDAGSADVLEALGRIAPVFAVRGNVDEGAWAMALPETLAVRAGDALLYVLHDLKRMQRRPHGVQAVISGHSHQPSIEQRGSVLYLNPGSAGPRRFRLPVSLARMEVRGDIVAAEIIQLQVASEHGIKRR
jgi:uncharacterized protein